jgi:VWFA-related protein
MTHASSAGSPAGVTGLVMVWVSVSLAAQAPVFRAAADVVLVPVAVTQRGRPVSGLTATDFEVLDRGIAQTVQVETADALPIDVTLVVDTSASVRGRTLAQFAADIQAVARSLGTADRIRLLTFGTSVTDVTGFQPGGRNLPLGQLVADGGSSFYNAVAAALLTVPRNDRSQLVFVLSDGRDTMSFLDASQLVELAARSPATLVLAVVSPPDRPLGAPVMVDGTTPYDGGPNVPLLGDAAARTGGFLIQRGSGTSLAALFAVALTTHRASYIITFSPAPVGPRGWHELRIRVRRSSNYEVRTRAGYEWH